MNVIKAMEQWRGWRDEAIARRLNPPSAAALCTADRAAPLSDTSGRGSPHTAQCTYPRCDCHFLWRTALGRGHPPCPITGAPIE